jgi:hypothetical protein
MGRHSPKPSCARRATELVLAPFWLEERQAAKLNDRRKNPNDYYARARARGRIVPARGPGHDVKPTARRFRASLNQPAVTS